MNFLTRIFSPVLLIFSLLILSFIIYKSEIVLVGSQRDYYFKFYLLVLLLIFFSILSFFFKRIIKTYLIIIFISFFVSIYVFEYYLIKFSPEINHQNSELQIKKKIYTETTGKKWDTRSQYQVYRDLLKNNSDVVPYYYPSEINIDGIKIHSLSGVSNSLTVFCNENGYFSINQSDRYGFNNPDEEWDSGNIEYVFVGDSFTHGYCVNRPNDIPSVVRKLSNKSVLNLGYGRNGPLIEYATLREYLPQNSKKIIFMYYGGNDLDNLNDELNKNILNKYTQDLNFNQNLKNIQNNIDKIKRKNILVRSKGENYKFLKLKKLRNYFKNKTLGFRKSKKNNQIYKFDIFENILILIKNLSIQNKSEFYFVYLHSKRYFDSNSAESPDLKYFDKIRSIAEKLNIKFIDIHKEVFEKEKNPKELFPFGMYGHYNHEGYKKVAEVIYNFTKN